MSGLQSPTAGDTPDKIQSINRLSIPRYLFTGLVQQELLDGDAVEILRFAVEIVFHELYALVETVTDLRVVVDPVDCVFWHEYLLVSDHLRVAANHLFLFLKQSLVGSYVVI